MFASFRRRGGGFSYVGACQVLMGLYIFVFRGLSRLVAFAQSLPQSQRRGRMRRTIRVRVRPRRRLGGRNQLFELAEIQLPAHEIPCASDDAHSRSRALRR